MPTILAIDTATEQCSVALSHGDKVYLQAEVAPQKHANLVLAQIDAVLNEAGLKRADIEAIGYGAGPGSFTGVRIALATAQALGLGLDKKVFAVSDLKLLVADELLAAPEGALGLACTDARMGEVYFALFAHEHGLKSLIAEKVVKPEQAVAEINTLLAAQGKSLSVVAGTGIALLQAQGLALPPKLTAELKLYPRADSIITCAQVEAPLLVDPAEAEPLYCRNEVTWKKVSEQKHH